MGYKILDFGRLDLPKTYLQSLPDPYLDFIVSSGLMVNDLSVFVKLLLGFSNRDIKYEEEIHILVLHQLTIFRTFGSKIYEACLYHAAFAKKVRRSKLPEGASLADHIDKIVYSIKITPEYVIAEKIRNDVTHHYQLKDIRASLDKMPEHHRLTMLFGENHGNSFYPLSDEIGYLTLFADDGQSGVTVGKMLVWYAETAGVMIDTQQSVIQHIFHHHKPQRGHRKKLFIDDKYVATVDTRLPTLMMRK